MTELSEREGMGNRPSVGRGRRPLGQRPLGERVVGVGTLGAIVVAAAYVLGQMVHNPFFSFPFALFFFAVAFVCGVATPTALGLLRGEASEPRQELAYRRSRRAEAGLEGSGSATRHDDAAQVERQLLEAIERHGEITPARAALDTALTVADADRMLGELAQKGYLEVRAREGKLVYSF